MFPTMFPHPRGKGSAPPSMGIMFPCNTSETMCSKPWVLKTLTKTHQFYRLMLILSCIEIQVVNGVVFLWRGEIMNLEFPYSLHIR